MKSLTPDLTYFHKHRFIYILACLLLIVLFAISFSKSFSALFAHGISWHLLIPIISGYAIWAYREKYFTTTVSPSIISGAITLCIAYSMVFAGDASSTLIISELAFVVGIWGVTIFLGGLHFYKKLFWPLVYLLFISSATEGIFDIVTPFFRYASASGASYIANFTGYTVLLSETFIRLPFLILNVADECSGVNQLISLFIIAIPLAFFTQSKIWPGLVLVASSIPIALLSNSIRIFILIVYNYNRKVFSHGPHDLFMTDSGFLIGLAILYLLSSALSHFTVKSVSHKVKAPAESRGTILNGIKLKNLIFLSVVLFCGFISLNIWKAKDDSPLPDFSQLTNPIPGWKSSSVNAASILDTLPVPDAEYRVQLTNNSDSIYLYLGWYKKQLQGKEIAGSLYDQYFKQYDQLRLKINSSDSVSFRLCRRKAAGFSYWIIYRSFDKYTSDPFRVKLYTLSDAIFHRSTSGSIIIFAIPDSMTDNFVNSGRAEKTMRSIFNLVEASFANKSNHTN